MPEKFKFTQKRVRELLPPEPVDGKTVRKDYHDTEQPRLILRVSSTGSKSYAVLKKDQTGKSRRVTIGNASEVTVSDARIEAGKILQKLNSGIDPLEERRIQKARSQTLAELLEAYLENHNLKPGTVSDYRQKMKWGFGDWLPHSATKITEKKVLSRHKRLTEQGKTTTNGAFRALRAVLNYSCATGAIDSNPVQILSTARLWHKNNRKNDLIESHQLKEWIDSVSELTPPLHQTAFMMMLYMGFRIMETYSLEWSDVDLKNELIIQRDTKNGTDHELPIPSVLLPLILTLKDTTGGGRFMFPAPTRKGKPETHLSYPKRAIKQVNDNLSFHFNPHMARHTFTTIAEAVNIPKTMIDRLTNHTTTNDVTGGYIHTETETLREAINKIAAYIQAKISSDEKVVNSTLSDYPRPAI